MLLKNTAVRLVLLFLIFLFHIYRSIEQRLRWEFLLHNLLDSVLIIYYDFNMDKYLHMRFEFLSVYLSSYAMFLLNKRTQRNYFNFVKKNEVNYV